MEEKFRIEEETRQALLRYGDDVLKVQTAVGRPYEYVIKIQQKMRRELAKSPDLNFHIAANMAREIIRGRRQRLQNLKDMLNSLEGRDQLWVCPICNIEVNDIEAEGVIYYFCPKCQKRVDRTFLDKDKIFSRKQSLLTQLLGEDDHLIDWMIKMGFTAKDQPPPPGNVTNIGRQNVLVIGGGNGTDPKVLEELKHLPPLEADKLRQDLKKEILKIDEEILHAEQEDKDADSA